MNQEVFVLFTMDVEPTQSDSGVSGPVSEVAGLRSVEAYHNVLRSWGYRATYFVHPEVAQAQPGFFRDLATDGSALGLHLHTTKFAPAKQNFELGGLTALSQRKILQAAIEIFESALGFGPRLFRPGCFSANDSTYRVLADLGFDGGSVSIPGRIWPERFCVWSGAHPYAHLAHESFRQCVGELPFVEIPLSVDIAAPLSYHPVGFYHYPDLRPGGVYAEEEEIPHDRRGMLSHILQKMALDDPPVKTLVVDVHNDRDFSTADAQAASHLRAVLEGLAPETEQLRLQLVPSTYDEIVRHCLTVLGPHPPLKEEHLSSSERSDTVR